MTNKYDIFISYSRHDLKLVTKIKNELERETASSCWMDLDGIESGEQFENVIISAINRSNTVLFMMSTHSMNSEWALDELNFAKEKKKRIVLVVIEDVKITDVFYFRFHKYDQIEWENQQQREKLIRDVKKWKAEVEKQNNRENKSISEKGTKQENLNHSVFISYSRHDYVDNHGEVIPGSCVSEIMKALEKNGISYWIDKEGIYSGDEFKGLLTTAIEQAQVFLFISSESSNKSEWTAKEINVAVYEKKKIIPILIDDAKYNSSVKLDLVGLDFINYKSNPALALRELVKSIKKTLGTSDVDVKKVKEEIRNLEKEGYALYAKEKRLYDEIASKKRLIGEGNKTCPACEEVAEVNSLYCPRCGWAYIPFSTQKLDEKRLDTAQRVWKSGITNNKSNETTVSYELPAPIKELIDNMVKVEGGTFVMGGTKEQGDEAFRDEKPPHKVTLSTYYIGRYPVTQEQWKSVMGNNPSYFQGERHPVEMVSWDDCEVFVKKLKEMTGMRFRLPTEAEWEYAARGGNRGKGYKYSGGDLLQQIAWYNENSGGTSHEVGKKSPNELGLYDMSGNIWEWVQDWKGNFTEEELTNPTGPKTGDEKVCRGGGWNREHDRCRVSYRGDDLPDLRYCSLGLRIALDE